ncbi:hypothetical protein EDD18DRAFT_1107799 [Armillaria luteobubalina]|uniref:Uncharacterized protein n=1 Tax=Armillaria luteobubalina TaxID=153913 RepID=A0AA39UL46_9AGAR|nr:hypothetical protein EDD18DRAFT_1107799 [Armillaria luteobubalina]
MAATGTSPGVKKVNINNPTDSTQAPPMPAKIPPLSLKIVPVLGTPHHPPPKLVQFSSSSNLIDFAMEYFKAVIGVSGAIFQCHLSLASMCMYYSNALTHDNVEVVPRPSNDNDEIYDNNDE